MLVERSAAGLRAHEFVLSNLSPSVAQRRFALGVVLVLLVVFIIVAGPLSGLPLRRVDAFIPPTALQFSSSTLSPQPCSSRSFPSYARMRSSHWRMAIS